MIQNVIGLYDLTTQVTMHVEHACAAHAAPTILRFASMLRSAGQTRLGGRNVAVVLSFQSH